MDQFKAIESVRMSVKHAKRKNEMGKKIDPGRARLGEKMDQLVLYTSLVRPFVPKFCFQRYLKTKDPLPLWTILTPSLNFKK